MHSLIHLRYGLPVLLCLLFTSCFVLIPDNDLSVKEACSSDIPHFIYFNSEEMAEGVRMILNEDGSVVTLGKDNWNNWNINLIKTDKYNEVVWHLDLNYNNEQANSIYPTSDGGYILCGTQRSNKKGNDILLLKISPWGFEEWTAAIGDTLDQNGSVAIPTDDGGFMVLGRNTNSVSTFNAVLMKVDSSGAEEWSRTFVDPRIKNTVGYSLVRLQDDHFAFFLSNTFGPTDEARLVKVDKQGKDLWSTELKEAGNISSPRLSPTKDGGVVLTGTIINPFPGDSQVATVKISADGIVEWKKAFGRSNSAFGNVTRQLEDGSYITLGYEVCGESDLNVPNRDILLIKRDDKGEELWATTFNSSSREFELGQDLILEKDLGFILCGSAHTSDNPRGDHMFLLRVDPQGNARW